MDNSLTPYEENSAKVLLCLYLSLLRNTYCPDTVALSVLEAQELSQRLGVEQESFQRIRNAVSSYWDLNRQLEGLF